MATHQQDQLIVVNPTDSPFSVKWAGNPYTLQPNQQMIWPRFLAEHFAKHLTDSILLKREEKAKDEYKKSGRPMSDFIPPSLLNSRKERPLVVNLIVKGVYTYYMPQAPGGADAIQREIDQWNKPAQPEQEKVSNMGDATDSLFGKLEDNDDDEALPAPAPVPPVQPPVVPAAVPTATDVQNVIGGAPVGVVPPPVAPAPPIAPAPPPAPVETGLAKRTRLMKEARQLGIKTNPNMTIDDLESQIKKQYA